MIGNSDASPPGDRSNRATGGPPDYQPARIPSIPPGIGQGTVLDHTYELLHPLGEGAMGMVYLAKDLKLDRQVAIKFIQPDLVRSAESHERFLVEARTMARVQHVNVVRIHTYGEFLGAPYFVMEYIPGSTVDQWLAGQPGTFPSVDEAIGLLDQICQGVEMIHRAGAVHRDLKPANILIGPAFRVCVSDLGLARALDKPLYDEAKDTVSGTPAYMAPEVVIGLPLPEHLESRADVYSLGVLAFEMFTGRLPFEYEDPTDMMLAHVEQEPPVPSDLRQELSPIFDRVLLKAIHKDPAERTPSAEAFKRDLLEARESVSSDHSMTASGSIALSPERILVADDDEDFRALVAETLRFAFPGAEIIEVGDGNAALEAVSDEAAALAVVDLDMPGMNGIELTAAFRASAHLQGMPIIVATATGGAPDWRLLQTLGAEGFLVKPIDPISLIALARRIVGKRTLASSRSSR